MNAISFLADEAGASPEYKAQLFMLIEYLRVSGSLPLIVVLLALFTKAWKVVVQHQKYRVGTALKVNPVTPEISKVTSTHHPFIEGLLKTLQSLKQNGLSLEELNGCKPHRIFLV